MRAKAAAKITAAAFFARTFGGARENLQNALTGFEEDANADLAAALRQELRGCVIAYEVAKAQAGALDFLDLLLKTRDLIRDNPEVRSSFQQRFKRIFVDEFQDTDPLQAEILLLLAAGDPTETNWRKIRSVPGKLFLVGDPSSRSIVSGAPTWEFIAAYTRCYRRPALNA